MRKQRVHATFRNRAADAVFQLLVLVSIGENLVDLHIAVNLAISGYPESDRDPIECVHDDENKHQRQQDLLEDLLQ